MMRQRHIEGAFLTDLKNAAFSLLAAVINGV